MSRTTRAKLASRIPHGYVLRAPDARENKKKTRREPGLFESVNARRAYPAGMRGGNRRARDVMPAAMRALVTICGWATIRFMAARFSKGADVSGKPAPAQLRCRSSGSVIGLAIRSQWPPYSAGATLTRTRRRSPGS